MGVSGYLTFFLKVWPIDWKTTMHLVWPCNSFILPLSHFPISETKLVLNFGGTVYLGLKQSPYNTDCARRKSFFLARYPLLTISITHCVTYDLMMIGRKKNTISLGQSKLRRSVFAKCKKNGELELRQAEFPLEQFITNVLQYLATLVEVSCFYDQNTN